MQTWCFYKHMPLCTGAFTQGCFYPRSFYTQTRRYFYTQMPLHSDAPTPDCFHPLVHVLLHGNFFDTSSLYTQKLLHKYFCVEMVPTRNAFIQRRLLHTDVCTRRCFLHSFFKREMLLHRGAFRLGYSDENSFVGEAGNHFKT